MTPDQLRASFIAFFEERGHAAVPSSQVIPEGDPTLLFTNAGMNQFKDVLLGLEKRDYVRATSVQKCIRAGGKHNDLDEVGKDGRHLTFFEMLGNWSFGDYYKREAIAWAWEYVTGVLGFDPALLRVSVYRDDDESWDIWEKEIGVPVERITRLGHVEEGDEENFWSMGPTGPCGPCTEIYVDQYPDRAPEPWAPGFDEDRFIEIWNLVFMEFNRAEDGSLSALPIRSVDTGMGLERVAAILAGVDNVFHTGLFDGILTRIHALRGQGEMSPEALRSLPEYTAYCVIADHIRSVAFCVSEGATFSNDGRGYVLRRILRRAVRFGRELGFVEPFLHQVAEAVVEDFGGVYPELRLKQRESARIIRQEEERFFRTLDRGLALFEEVATRTRAQGGSTLPGDDVFRLYDTFGFPPDLTRIMAEERDLSIDEAGYEAAMEAQRDRSRKADTRHDESGDWIILREGAADRFVGYDNLEAKSQVLRYRIHEDGLQADVCLVETPFYAESGGQVGDRGTLHFEGFGAIEVVDTQKTTAGITHLCRLPDGEAPTAEAWGSPVRASVDARARALTTCNHTATHLLHAALHRHVSPSAFQAGSLVSPDRLRFDFSHDRGLSADELQRIEAEVNAVIQEDIPLVIRRDVSIDEAERMGAMMIFGEKYGDQVRVVDIPGRSTELCGGCHVPRTGQIAWFRITGESGVAAGVRRIEAVTNAGAFALAQQERDQLRTLSRTLKTPADALEERVRALLDEQRNLERQLESLTAKLAHASASALSGEGNDVEGVKLVTRRVDARNRDELLALADALRDSLQGEWVVLLGAVIEDKPALLLQVSDDAASARGLHAGKLINVAAAPIGGRGGGRPTLAQAGGQDAGALEGALAGFEAALRSALS